MKKFGLYAAAFAIAVLMSASAWATHKGFAHGKGNACDDASTPTTCEDTSKPLTGAHYNLNLIGVSHEKTAKMDNSKRHTIFVPLMGKSDIWLVQGDFQVCDGNAFDTAIDCGGAFIKNESTLGAVFQLPCNEAVNGEEECEGNSTGYEVWVRELGKPGGGATIQTCVESGGTRFCSTESVVLVRSNGKSTFRDVSKKLTTVCLDTDSSGSCDTRYRLFTGDFENWLWEYDNDGLRLAQLRFYVL